MESDSAVIAVTGTRRGFSTPQIGAFGSLLLNFRLAEFHHGDCVGVDDEAATFCHTLLPRPRIIGHPGPLIAGGVFRARNRYTDEWKPVVGFMARNRHLVHICDILVVCPGRMEEEFRSGTWQTCRYARRTHRHLYICWPDGSITEENA